MRNRKMAGTLALALAICGAIAVGPARAASADEQAVQQASDSFYKALNEMFTGEVAPMVDVWSHADDVTYMGPGGGMQLGWDQVLASWESQAGLTLGGKIEAADLQIVIGTDLAVTYCYEIGENETADGEPENVSIRATNVYRKENGQWKMIGHHTDLLPFLEN
jgi:ketosteroid isomerase-like protein